MSSSINSFWLTYKVFCWFQFNKYSSCLRYFVPLFFWKFILSCWILLDYPPRYLSGFIIIIIFHMICYSNVIKRPISKNCLIRQYFKAIHLILQFGSFSFYNRSQFSFFFFPNFFLIYFPQKFLKNYFDCQPDLRRGPRGLRLRPIFSGAEKKPTKPSIGQKHTTAKSRETKRQKSRL